MCGMHEGVCVCDPRVMKGLLCDRTAGRRTGHSVLPWIRTEAKRVM